MSIVRKRYFTKHGIRDKSIIRGTRLNVRLACNNNKFYHIHMAIYKHLNGYFEYPLQK